MRRSQLFIFSVLRFFCRSQPNKRLIKWLQQQQTKYQFLCGTGQERKICEIEREFGTCNAAQESRDWLNEVQIFTYINYTLNSERKKSVSHSNGNGSRNAIHFYANHMNHAYDYQLNLKASVSHFYFNYKHSKSNWVSAIFPMDMMKQRNEIRNNWHLINENIFSCNSKDDVG